MIKNITKMFAKEIYEDEEPQVQILSTINRKTFLEIHHENQETFRWLGEICPLLELPFAVKIKKQEDESNKEKL